MFFQKLLIFKLIYFASFHLTIFILIYILKNWLNIAQVFSKMVNFQIDLFRIISSYYIYTYLIY